MKQRGLTRVKKCDVSPMGDSQSVYTLDGKAVTTFTWSLKTMDTRQENQVPLGNGNSYTRPATDSDTL